LDISNIIQNTIEKIEKIQKNKNRLTSKTLDLDENMSKSLRLTQSFNDSFSKTANSSITITPLSIIKDDIKNLRILSEIQIAQISTFSEKEMMDIIKLYNVMIEQIQFIL